jgi:hypothetical protein
MFWRVAVDDAPGGSPFRGSMAVPPPSAEGGRVKAAGCLRGETPRPVLLLVLVLVAFAGSATSAALPATEIGNRCVASAVDPPGTSDLGRAGLDRRSLDGWSLTAPSPSGFGLGSRAKGLTGRRLGDVLRAGSVPTSV